MAVYELTLADEDGEEISLYVNVMLDRLLTTDDGFVTDAGEAEYMEYNGLSCVLTVTADGYRQQVKLYGFANLSVARSLGTIVPSLLDVEGEYTGKTTIRR